MNPEQRKAFVDDTLKKRGLYVETPSETHEQAICRTAVGIFNGVTSNVAQPLLAALNSPSQYDSAGTQRLLKDAFQSRFNTFGKDELVILLSIMHAEELEKQCRQMADAGLVGKDKDKPL
jgi:hypothetical protein